MPTADDIVLGSGLNRGNPRYSESDNRRYRIGCKSESRKNHQNRQKLPSAGIMRGKRPKMTKNGRFFCEIGVFEVSIEARADVPAKFQSVSSVS